MKKKYEKSDISVDTSSSLIDLAFVVDSQGMLQSPDSGIYKDKKKRLTSSDHSNKSDTSKPAKSSLDRHVKSISGSRSAKSSVEAKIDAWDLKWSKKIEQAGSLTCLPETWKNHRNQLFKRSWSCRCIPHQLALLK